MERTGREVWWQLNFDSSWFNSDITSISYLTIQMIPSRSWDKEVNRRLVDSRISLMYYFNTWRVSQNGSPILAPYIRIQPNNRLLKVAVNEQRHWGDWGVSKAYKNQKEIDYRNSVDKCCSHASFGFLSI